MVESRQQIEDLGKASQVVRMACAKALRQGGAWHAGARKPGS